MKNTVRYRLLLLLAALLGGTLTLAQQKAPSSKPSAESLAGCYNLKLSEWTPHMNLGTPEDGDIVFITPPKDIYLSKEHGKDGFEKRGYLIRPVTGTKASIHRWSYWAMEEDGAVSLVWTTGFSGLTMKLTPEQKTRDLKGTARTFWDFGRPEQTAEVNAVRIECPSGTQPSQ